MNTFKFKNPTITSFYKKEKQKEYYDFFNITINDYYILDSETRALSNELQIIVSTGKLRKFLGPRTTPSSIIYVILKDKCIKTAREYIVERKEKIPPYSMRGLEVVVLKREKQ